MHTAPLQQLDRSYPLDASPSLETPKRPVTVSPEVKRLTEENEHLRQTCQDLTVAAESWIRLYELALARANAADARLAALEVLPDDGTTGNRNA
jgi:hypothetical protein